MIVLGTRGSDLARAQTAMVEAALPETAVKIISTRGDEKSGQAVEPIDRQAGRKGLFTAEIERALLEREIDVAIHSAKDLPSEATVGLEICAVLPRAAVEDVLISKTADSLAAIATGATIGTGSVRRQHQLRWVRPDLQISDLRGNVPTRLRKLAESSWAGIILARAGLERLKITSANWRMISLPNEQFLPAGGQGIIALQIRADDLETRRALMPLDHAETHLCLRAEREFLRLLQGDCGTPVGILAQIESDWLHLRAQVFADANSAPNIGDFRMLVEAQSPEAIAAELFQQMYGS